MGWTGEVEMIMEEGEENEVRKKMMSGSERDWEDTWMTLHTLWLRNEHSFAGEKRKLKSSEISFINNCPSKESYMALYTEKTTLI